MGISTESSVIIICVISQIMLLHGDVSRKQISRFWTFIRQSYCIFYIIPVTIIVWSEKMPCSV